MLYKKVHRQYLRQFRVGRKFKCYGFVYEITKEKPYIDIKGGSIRIDHWYLILIAITGSGSGQLWIDVEWVED